MRISLSNPPARIPTIDAMSKLKNTSAWMRSRKTSNFPLFSIHHPIFDIRHVSGGFRLVLSVLDDGQRRMVHPDATEILTGGGTFGVTKWAPLLRIR